MGYHRGELVVQERAGLLEQAAHVGTIVRRTIPSAVEEFLAEQPMLVIGGVDADGDLWATMLTGEPGFIRVTGPTSCAVAATPTAGDPLSAALAAPAQVGMIAIEPGARRRVRMNGTAHPTPDGLRVDLAEIYPNCPKYIQGREPHLVASTPAEPETRGELSGADLALVAATDTFFIATTDLSGSRDVSHRGGSAGFLRAVSPRHLRWPDYVGNSMFNTLGNLEVDPRAGLLLPDWSTGTLVHLTGTARVDWDPDHAASVPGAQRLVDFSVERVVRIPHASPLRWGDPEYSRFNPEAAQRS